MTFQEQERTLIKIICNNRSTAFNYRMHMKEKQASALLHRIRNRNGKMLQFTNVDPNVTIEQITQNGKYSLD